MQFHFFDPSEVTARTQALLAPFEGFKPRAYWDGASPVNFPTIGLGFNLATAGNDYLRLALEQIYGTSGIDIPGFITSFNAIVPTIRPTAAQYSQNRSFYDAQLQTELDTLVSQHLLPEQTFFPLELTRPQADSVERQILDGYSIGGVPRDGKLANLQRLLFDQNQINIPSNTNEFTALASLFYNRETLIGSKLLAALRSGDRAEAWYEIRYQSNRERITNRTLAHGIANRRYAESDTFGLYENAPLTEVEAKSVFRMYTAHRAVIQTYESDSKTSPGSTDSFSYESQNGPDGQNARALLIATYGQSQSIDGDILVGKDDANGSDALIGTASNDLIFGEKGNDILAGGQGNDVLYGGEGFDTYIYNTGDGTDRIEDTQGANAIIFDNQLLQGGIHRSQDAPFTYTSLDGRFTYVISSTDLIVNGTLILNDDFQDGQFGIHLKDESVLPTGVPPVIDYNNGFPDFTKIDGDGDDAEALFGFTNYIVHGNGGNDTVLTGPGNDQLFGETGNDSLQAGSGQDRLDGGDGDDYLEGGAGDDVLSGGAGRDVLVGDVQNNLSVVGNDYLDGGAGDDDLEGKGGDDILLGGTGNDLLLGDDDALDPARPAGKDYLDGGDGADKLYGGLGDDVLVGGLGDDRLFGDNIPFDPSLNATRYSATGGNDYLDGGEGNDLLQGDGGDDILLGGAGNDLLFGDDSANPTTVAGNDFLDGGDGIDELQGGGGNDILYGGTGNDLLFGDDPNAPSIVGGNDTLDGGAGDDELQGGGGDDVLVGGIGNDLLFGDDPNAPSIVGNDVLDGGDGNDSLYGQAGNDELLGGDGTDQLTGGTGDDTLAGGAGNDTYVFNVGDGHDTITDTALPGEGNVLSFGSGITLANLTLTPDTALHTLTIQVGAGGDTITLEDFDLNNVDGTVVVQTLYFTDIGAVSLGSLLPLPDGLVNGTTTDDVIHTGTGDDVIQGFAGNDYMDAGTGADVLIGGAGNDTLIGGAGNDVYVFSLGDGVDTIYDDTTGGDTNTLVFDEGIAPTDITLGLGSLLIRVGSSGDAIHIPNFNPNDAYGTHAIDSFQFADGTVLTYSQLIDQGFDLTGTAGADTITGTNAVDRITGLAGNDTITSGAGDDVLDGGPGADSMTGGTGNDTYVVDDPGDVVTEGPNEGNDTVQSSISYTLVGTNLENLTLTGTSAINGTGNTLDNILSGALNSAANSLTGGLGNDTYIVGTGDTIIENAGQGTDTVVTDITYTLVANLENLTLTGTVANNGTGNVLDNVLTGNSAANVLDGGAGNDTLIGGAGSDTYIFGRGSGHDTVVESDVTGTDVDTIQLGALVAPSQVILQTNPQDDLVLSIAGTSDQLTVPSFFSSPGAKVERITFVDGTIWDSAAILARAGVTLTGTSGADTLTGTGAGDVLNGLGGDDLLNGRGGNDTLNGAAGNDTYIFNPSDGQDTIFDDEVGAGTQTDTVQLGATILPADVGFEGKDNNLVISFAGTTDSITVQQWFNYSDEHERYRVERLQFADSTIMNIRTMPDIANTVTGTDGNEALTGLSHLSNIVRGLGGDDQLFGGDQPFSGTAANILDGGPGNDELRGGPGNDILIGGPGNDTLDAGTSGQDTYIFNLGDGQDTITRIGPFESGSVGTLQLGPGIGPGDVHLDGTNDTLVVSFTGSTDTVTAVDWFDRPDLVKWLQFADGTVWDLTTQTDIFNTIVGGPGNDFLDGGPERNVLRGLGGNDWLNGEAGADVLEGGPGDDTEVVDDPGDVVTELANEGTDTVESSITYALGANVENLTLIGSDPINGTGNALNNILIGNSGDNVLDGGAGADGMAGGLGNDTYVVDDAGDTVTEAANAGGGDGPEFHQLYPRRKRGTP